MPDDKVQTLIRTHVERYTEIDILDIYKLLHQAIFGPGHAIKSIKPAREWLEREAEILQPGPPDQPLVENIHPDEQIVRVHLRPYLAAGGSLGRLLEAFVQSSAAVHGNPETMADWWNIFYNMTLNGGEFATRFDSRTVALITRSKAAEKWPASHHSPLFDRAYRPAYRVVTRKTAESMLKDQRISFTLA